jgi:hypothetical protein
MTSNAASSSLLLRSSHILLMRIESATAEPWSGIAGGEQRRTAHLEAVLEEILRGQARQKSGDRVRAIVEQFYDELPMGMPRGVWSYASLAPGTRLLIFSNSVFNDAAELMMEPKCLRVAPEESLTGVRLALLMESGKMTIAELLRNANSSADLLDDIFIEYLSTRLGDPLLVQLNTFRLLMTLLENPKLQPTLRSWLLMTTIDEAMRSTTFSDRDIDDVVIVLFHLLGRADAEPLHHNLASVYLPNLLGLSGGVAPRTDEVVFHDRPEERDKVRGILESHSGDPDVARLLDWLK